MNGISYMHLTLYFLRLTLRDFPNKNTLKAVPFYVVIGEFEFESHKSLNPTEFESHKSLEGSSMLQHFNKVTSIGGFWPLNPLQ